jgi:hypothetical protein
MAPLTVNCATFTDAQSDAHDIRRSATIAAVSSRHRWGVDPPLQTAFQMSNTVLLVCGGLAALIFVVIAVGRVTWRRSATKFGEDLSVSRTWLIEHSARKSD